MVGGPRTYHKKFKFLVEIDGFTGAAFQSCSELAVNIAKIEQHEGGALIPNKSAGRATYDDITLERGATSDEEFFNWMKQLIDASVMPAINSSVGPGVGLNEPLYKKTLVITQQDRDGSPLRQWRVFNAWPTKYSAGAWDNNADENVIESLVLTYDYFEIIP